MKIALLGWGPMIFEPQPLRLESKWFPDGVELPLELCRISGGHRLTLALNEGTEPIRSYWALSKEEDLTRAGKNLRQREKTFPEQVHHITREGERDQSTPELYAGLVGAWLEEQSELDAVCWVGLESNWKARRGTAFSIDDALAYLRELENAGFTKAAREYFQKIPPQNHTKVHRRVQEELGWETLPEPEDTVVRSR